MREESDWAGVFLSSEDESALRAFASFEPPAHDDWVPDRLRGADATLVRVTVRKRIPEAVRQRFGVVPLSNFPVGEAENRSEEHTSELQSLMRNSYAVFCLKQNNIHT